MQETVCCFDLFNRYWGIVPVPGFRHERAKGARTHVADIPPRPVRSVPPLGGTGQGGTRGDRARRRGGTRNSGGRTLHLNYVAGYTNTFLFLFERTHTTALTTRGFCPGQSRRCPQLSSDDLVSAKCLIQVSFFLFCLFVNCYETRNSLLRLPLWARSKPQVVVIIFCVLKFFFFGGLNPHS